MVPLNVVKSSCDSHALRSIQLHRVQYSIATDGGRMAEQTTAGTRKERGAGVRWRTGRSWTDSAEQPEVSVLSRNSLA